MKVNRLLLLLGACGLINVSCSVNTLHFPAKTSGFAEETPDAFVPSQSDIITSALPHKKVMTQDEVIQTAHLGLDRRDCVTDK